MMLELAKIAFVIRRLDGVLPSDVKSLGYANILLEYRGKKY
jgi:hypothetical protein